MSWQPGMTLHDVKIKAIERALDFHNGNKSRAARALGISTYGLRLLVNAEDRLARFRNVWPKRVKPE